MTLRGPVGHLLDRRLVLQEIAAVDRVVEVLPFTVAQLARLIIAAINPSLSTDAVGSFDRRQTHQVNVDPQLGQFHCGGQSGQATAYDHHTLFSHPSALPSGFN